MAVNCWVSPEVILGLAGVTTMDCKTGGPTVKIADPLTASDIAMIVVGPA